MAQSLRNRIVKGEVRLTILEARDCPTIREFGLFKASAANK